MSISDLEGPLRDQTHIETTYGGRTNELKSAWAENPKAPLANYGGSGISAGDTVGEGRGFRVVEGIVGGQKVFRYVFRLGCLR